MIRTGALASGAAAKGTVLSPDNSAQNHRKHRNKHPNHPPRFVFLPLMPSSSHFYNPQVFFCLLLQTITSKDSQKLLYQVTQSQAVYQSDWHPPPTQTVLKTEGTKPGQLSTHIHKIDWFSTTSVSPSYLLLRKGIFFQVWKKCFLQQKSLQGEPLNHLWNSKSLSKLTTSQVPSQFLRD